MVDTSRLEILRERDLVLFGFDVEEWVPMQVLRRRLSYFQYTFAKDIGGFNGAATSTWKNLVGGASNIPVLANAPANSTVTGQSANFQAISGVTDIFQIQNDYEILQVWMGIAPSPLRVWLQQPPSQYENVMDNNIYPLSQGGQVIDALYIDGFESPYNYPSQQSEFFSFKNIQVQFSLANPVLEQIAPRIKFVINQLKIAPVGDPATIAGMFSGRVPCRKATIGQAMGNVTWSGAGYGGVQGLPSNTGLLSNNPGANGAPSPLATLLAQQGYISAGA